MVEAIILCEWKTSAACFFRQDDKDLWKGQPPVIALPRMAITTCCQDIVAMVHATLQQAVSKETRPRLAEMLWNTAKDMLHLFLAIVPKMYASELQLTPRLAMLHHNDARFITHHLAIIGHMYRRSLPEPLSRTATMMDLFPKFRKIEVSVFVNQLETQSSELKRIMAARAQQGEMGLDGAIFHLQKLCNVWIDVLPLEDTPELVELRGSRFHRALGALVSFVIAALGDISKESDDAHALVHLHDFRIAVHGLFRSASGECSDAELSLWIPNWRSLTDALSP